MTDTQDLNCRYQELLSDAEILEIADNIEGVVKHPGWPILMELAKGSRNMAGQIALDDEQAKLPYWKGYKQALLDFAATPSYILARAKQLGVKLERAGNLNPLRGSVADEGSTGTFD